MPLLLDIWREACRHIDADESIERIARLVAPRLHADLLVLRRLDVERARVETIAAGAGCAAPLPAQSRTDVPAHSMGELLTWWRSGRVITGDVTDEPFDMLVPPRLEGRAIAAPLTEEAGSAGYGVLVLVSLNGRRFTSADVAVAEQLIEPLGVALANDARVRELGRLREAVEADNRALLNRLDRHDLADTIIGASAGLRGVLDRVKQVAPTDAPVLILGETGTGKEVIARAVHAHSSRASGPVERVNCGALMPGLIDSELFGHERGSFTGAVSQRKGWFERADGGTLLLDEVGELPLDAQVRLLRILQDGTYERVGGSHTRTVDVRIIAATHRDLHTMVEQRTFREDLWYRIGVFPIRLPPLRERIEDIPTLAAHFAWRAGRRLGGVPLVPAQADIETLIAYSWPGNVRELAAVIERAVILGDGHRLEIATALGGAPVQRAPVTGIAQGAGAVAGVHVAARSFVTDGYPANASAFAAGAAHAVGHAANAMVTIDGAGTANASTANASTANASTANASTANAAGDARTANAAIADAASSIAPLNDAMRAHIERALARTHGRIEGPAGAAALLHINPHTLRARMKKLGVKRP